MAKFLTSARAVDMLGRQQIAGIPTALSELFKNAYDAYATEVRADYLPRRQILLLRDNGIGMSANDFVRRWLTIGTDSKARDGSAPPLARPRSLKLRTQMGEKGIGRLAVASIGPQLLIVSRAMPAPEKSGPSQVKDKIDDSIVVALVQWTLFEVPGLTLDDVVVPMRTVGNPVDVTQEMLEALAQEVRDCVVELGTQIPPSYAERIESALSKLTMDPVPMLR
jgi:hypothetical protein